jgi:hypothetical protein
MRSESRGRFPDGPHRNDPRPTDGYGDFSDQYDIPGCGYEGPSEPYDPARPYDLPRPGYGGPQRPTSEDLL